MQKDLKLRKIISIGILFAFLSNGLVMPSMAQDFVLPAPGVMVHLSSEFNPPILKGIKVHPDNPFRFDFIMDTGDDVSLRGASLATKQSLKEQSTKLIKYFLASLTIPEKDLWVNLSPYEKDRIIPNSFGLTEMGRDLLAEDYMLKQITASLIYPEDKIGKKFWKRIYEEAAKRYGTTNIPVNTFNKVWIVPEKAVVYENAKAGTAYVVESKLKVMLEQDYLSLAKHEGVQSTSQTKDTNQFGSQIVREIVIPQLSREVNEGKNFAYLRQVYNSLILATWYKKKIKDSILEQVYADKNKVAGVNIDDPQEKQKIYERYLQAFKKGVYDYIKEEQDPLTQQTLPRKYFSGGVRLGFSDSAMNTDLSDVAALEIESMKKPVDENTSKLEDLTIDMAMTNSSIKSHGQFWDWIEKVPSDQLVSKVIVLNLLKALVVGLKDSVQEFSERDIEIDKVKVDTLNSLIAAGLVTKEEVSEQIKEHNIVEAIVQGLRGSDMSVRKAYVNTLNSLIISGFVSKEEARERIKMGNILDILVQGFHDESWFMTGYSNMDAFKSLITGGFVTKEDVKEKRLNGMNILEALVGEFSRGNSLVKILIANTFNSLISAKLVTREDVIGKKFNGNNILEVLVQGLSDKDGDVGESNVKVFNSLIVVGLVTKEEVIEQIKEQNILEAIVNGLSDSNRFQRKANAATLNVLIAAGFVSNEEAKRRIKGQDILDPLVQLSGRDVSIQIAHLDTLNSLITAGLVTKEDVKKRRSNGKDILDAIVWGLEYVDKGAIKANANTLNSLMTLGLVSKKEAKDMLKEFYVLDHIVYRLINSHEDPIEAADKLYSLMTTGLVSKEEVKESIKRQNILEDFVRRLKSGSVDVMRARADTLCSLITSGLVTKEEVKEKGFYGDDLLGIIVPGLIHRDGEEGKANANTLSNLITSRLVTKEEVKEVMSRGENILDALVQGLSHENSGVSDAYASILNSLITAGFVDKDGFTKDEVKNMDNFMEDQNEGFGLENNYKIEGMNVLLAFVQSNDHEARDIFLTITKQLDQRQRNAFVDIAYGYFKEDAFKRFEEILKSHRRLNYVLLVDIFKADFLKVVGLDREIEGRIMNGWDGVARLLRMAGRYKILQEKIMPKIIVTLRLLRQGAGRDTGFRQAANIEGRFPELKNNLMRLLEDENISLSVKRQLLQSFPLGDREDIELLRRRAVRLADAATGLGDTREGLVGNIRNRIHNNPSAQDLPVVEAYRIFVETDGRKGGSRLKELGYRVSAADPIPESRKRQVLLACDDLLLSLRQVYGGGSLENIGRSMDVLTARLETEQQQRIAESSAKINAVLRQSYYGLDDLKAVVEMRQQMSDLIRHVGGEDLYQALNLDLRLELLVYKILNSIDKKMKNSPEGFLLMLKNSRLNGYGGELLERQMQELESVIELKDSRDKNMRLYAVIKKVERMIKNTLGEVINDYQTTAQETGKALGVAEQEQIWVDNFSSNIFRSDSVYLLSILMANLKKQIKNKLGLTGWEVVVNGTMSGELHYVDSLDRLNEVKKNEILVIDRLPSDSPVLSRVAGIIVFEEDSLLSHPAIRARQNGTPYVVCPDKELIEKYYGQKMTITVQGYVVDIKEEVTQASKVPVKRKLKIQVPAANLNSEVFLLPQDYSPGTSGQKAYNSHKMDSIPLADGQRRAKHLALSFAFHQEALQDPSNQKQEAGMKEILSVLEKEKMSNKQIAENLARMRSEIESMHIPRALLEQARDFIRQQIPHGLVFLRSSTNAEDLSGYAGAGLYDSFGAIDPDNLEQLETYIKKVWASVWNDRAYADRQRNGIEHLSVHMAVFVQELVNSTYSYVVHTVNPINNNPDEMMIEIAQGLGEALVSGSADYQGAPHRFVYNKKNGQIRRVGYADKDWRLVVKDGSLQRELTDYSDDIFINGNVTDILRGLFKQAKKVEQLFDMKAQDIEGCLVQEGANKFDSVFVQSRNQQGGGDRAMFANPVQKVYQQSRTDTFVSLQKPDETGGIDLTPANKVLQTQNAGEGIKFHLDPPMLQQLQNAPGFVPVIINIQPMRDLKGFLEGVSLK